MNARERIEAAYQLFLYQSEETSVLAFLLRFAHASREDIEAWLRGDL